MVILKIPIVALYLIVRWAIRQGPETAGEQGGGTGPGTRPLHPHNHPRSSLPRTPRRGPHGVPSPASPPRVRTVFAQHRLPRG